VRKILGKNVVAAHCDQIDGVNILLLFVFVCAVMGSLGQQILTHPMLVLELTLLAFVIFFILVTVTYFVFRFAGTEQAFALGMLASQRNMGLMLAATGGMVPDLTWLYFAVSQFPLYLSPLMLTPLVRRILKNGSVP
jgi:BASS family bile acid:Na+ symporter